MPQDDLHAMYSKYTSGLITIWCYGRVVEGNEGRRMKRKREEAYSKRQEKENKVVTMISKRDTVKCRVHTPQLRLLGSNSYS